MGQCYITRRGTKTGGVTEQSPIYPIGNDGRPTGDVVVSGNVTNISRYVFMENKNILSVTMLENVSNLDNYCFQKCTNLQQVSFSNNVNDIPQYCFSECSNITKVDLPTSVNTISPYSFSQCYNLQTIHIPASCNYINSNSFKYCQNLHNITIDSEAQFSMNNSVFSECTSLTNDDVKLIMEHCKGVEGTYIFAYCSGLTDIEVAFFATNMFASCENLKTAKSTTAYDSTGNNVFNNCTKLEEAYIADGVIAIGSGIFYNCNSLKTVYLPSSITTAKYNSLTSTSSSYYAFYNCTALEDVRLGQDWNMSLRLNVSNNITVESMLAMFNSLKDLTGDTAKILTLGETNLAKLTDEQKAIATNKNWTLA